MVFHSLDAAEILAQEGIETEVIDLRSLLPYDKPAILESVRKTNRVLVIHEDTLTGGFGGEIAAVVADEAFEHLDAPVRRIGAIDTPVPFSPPLESYFLPNTEKVTKALRDLVAY